MNLAQEEVAELRGPKQAFEISKAEQNTADLRVILAASSGVFDGAARAHAAFALACASKHLRSWDIAALRHATRDPDSYVRVTSVRALGIILRALVCTSLREAVVRVLHEAIDDEDGHIREAALEELGLRTALAVSAA